MFFRNFNEDYLLIRKPSYAIEIDAVDALW